MTLKEVLVVDEYKEASDYLESNFKHMYINCVWNGEELVPSDIVVTVLVDGKRIIGHGNTFVKAVCDIKRQRNEKNL